MYLMFGDEADAEQGRGQKFFVYGAVFIKTYVKALHDGIEKMRDKFGYSATDSLKFHDCPKQVTRDQHRDIKKGSREAGSAAGCSVLRVSHFARNRKRRDAR